MMKHLKINKFQIYTKLGSCLYDNRVVTPVPAQEPLTAKRLAGSVGPASARLPAEPLHRRAVTAGACEFFAGAGKCAGRADRSAAVHCRRYYNFCRYRLLCRQSRQVGKFYLKCGKFHKNMFKNMQNLFY